MKNEKIIFIPKKLKLSPKIEIRYYMNCKSLLNIESCLDFAIKCAFTWCFTNEGHDYWYQVLSEHYEE